MSAKVIYLVRHGQNDHSFPPPDSLGGGLTPLGRQQAESTARRLMELLSPGRPTGEPAAGLPPAGAPAAIYYSTLRRARQTAEFIAGVFPTAAFRANRLLHECSLPHFPEAYLSWRAAHPEDDLSGAGAPAELRRWLALTPAGLSLNRLVKETQRAARAYAYFFRPDREQGRVVILVSHGNMIRYLLCRALGVDPARWIHLDIRNAGISEVRIRPDGFCQVYAQNDAGHLPVELLTFM